jgi:hypothetical protein
MMYALSLSRMAEKALAEDEANTLLWRRVAELEEANAWLEESNAEMCLKVILSGDAVTAVQHELEEKIEHCERLKLVSARLLNACDEARNRVADLETKLAETETSAARNISALELKLAGTEAHAAESSAAAEKCLEDFCTKNPMSANFEASVVFARLSPTRPLRPKAMSAG